MHAPLQPPLVIGIAGTVAGLLTAALSLGLSRLPIWRHGRVYALVAVTAAGYAASDLVIVTDAPADVVAFGVQLACLFGVTHAGAWLAYLAALEARPLSKSDYLLLAGGGVVALAGLVPGALMTEHVVTIRVDWFGAVYRTPQPTVLGMVAYGYFALMMAGIAVHTLRRRRAALNRALLGWLVVLGAAGVSDTFVSAGWLNSPLLFDIVSATVVVGVAVANQRRLGGELAEIQVALARSERLASISRLAAGIAHEINNPLAILRHDLAQVAVAGAERGRHVAHALSAVDRIARVVKQFVDLGLASRPGTASVQTLDVAAAVTRAVARASARFPAGALAIDVPAQLAALADAERFDAALTALLSNAAYAVAERRPAAGEARVRVQAHAVGDRVEIDVIDNGPGLPADVRKRLFEPFVNTHPFGHGAGLGLAVAYGLMRSQAGALSLVESSPRGTTFRLDLPRGTASAPVLAAPPVIDRDDLRTLGLLIIDDDPDLRAVLGDAAEAYRFRPIVAATVEEALAIVRRGADIDIVLCDLMMPDGGAITWLRLAEREYPDLAARTVVITGGPSSAEALAFADAHPERILYKPFPMADVRDLARRLLAGRP